MPIALIVAWHALSADPADPLVPKAYHDIQEIPMMGANIVGTGRSVMAETSFSAQSAYRDDYHPPRLPSAPPVRAGRPRLCISFTGTSTSSDYRAFPCDALRASATRHVASPTNHISMCSPDAQFNWNSTQRDAFQYRQTPQPEQVRPPSTRRLVLPFTGQSTSRVDFQAPPAEVLHSRPGSAALRSYRDRDNIHVPDLVESAKFEGCSSYASEYTAIPLRPRGEHHLDHARYQDPPLPFEGQSECHSQYRTIDPASIKPQVHVDHKTFVSSISNPDTEFDATTEFRDSFKPIPIAKDDPVLEAYEPEPAILFDSTTEFRSSYRPYVLSAASHQVRPRVHDDNPSRT